MGNKLNDTQRISLEECAKHLDGLSVSKDEIEGIRDSLYLIIGEFMKDYFAQGVKSDFSKSSKSQ